MGSKEDKPMIGHFLGGVAAVIWDEQTDRYLLLRRAASRDFAAGAWEAVTGRVEQGEDYETALRREVREEIGGEVQIEFLIGTTHFFRGAATPENELLGVIYGCTLKNAGQIHFGAEHSEMHWIALDEAFRLLPEGHWLRPVLRRLELLRRLTPDELRTDFRQEGFEIS